MDAEEPIVLAVPSQEWERTYANEVAHLRRAFDWYGITLLEHVGSTAVPDIVARPIVDIALGVRLHGNLPPIGAKFWANIGYRDGGSNLDESWLYMIKRDDAGHRVAHLYVAPEGSGILDGMVAFRDALRTDPARAVAYETLKKRLSVTATSRIEYRDGKREFVARIIGA